MDLDTENSISEKKKGDYDQNWLIKITKKTFRKKQIRKKCKRYHGCIEKTLINILNNIYERYINVKKLGRSEPLQNISG